MASAMPHHCSTADTAPGGDSASKLTSSMQAPCYTSDLMNVTPTFEFHVSRSARDRYHFSDALFSLTGNAVFADLAASRDFAQRINVVRDAQRNPDLAVHPGTLNAMGLIDEALHI